MSAVTRLALLILLATSACADVTVADDDSTLGDDDVATTSQAVTAQGYWWDQSLGHPVRMMKESDGFCFLTEMTGHFAGMGEQVTIQGGGDGYWYLTGSSYQQGVAASARCVPWWTFNSTNHRIIDDTFGAPQVWGGAWASYNYYNTDYGELCPLTWFAGGLNGGGELAQVTMGVGGWTMLEHSGFSYKDNGLESGTVCVGLGQSGTIQYSGGDPNNMGESRWTQGQAPVALAPIASADCFLTGVTGRWYGGGEGVAIVDGGNGWWYLTGWSQQVDVGARARCVAHNQPGLTIPSTTRTGGWLP